MKKAITTTLITLLLCVTMVFGLFSLTAGAADAAADLTVEITGADGNPASVTLKDADSDGYYDIGTADELYAFAATVGSGNTSINGKLTADIVVNENVLDEDGELNGDGLNFRAWTPIGNYEKCYTGIFDGAEHTISGLYFNDMAQITVGLFGYIDGAAVQNLGVINSYFNAKDDVGGVVSCNYGTITNCYNTGTVNGRRSVGGVVGLNAGMITSCYNTGTVNGEGNDVGGVVGCNTDTTTSCYNAGAVNGESSVGGVAGKNYYGTVTNCYNAGAVNCENSVGGVVGENNEGTVTNCYYLESTATGGINGADEDGKAVAKTADEFASGEVAYKLGSAFGQTLEGENRQDYPVLGDERIYYGYISCAEDAEMVYTTDEAALDEKPDHTGDAATCLGQECDKCGARYGETDETNHAKDTYTNGFRDCCGAYEPAVLVDGYYEIGNAGQLYWFAEQVGGGNISINGKLTADIEVNENVLTDSGALNGDGSNFRKWTPIGNYEKCYTGIFDGAEHTVSGLYVNNTAQITVGLFGYIFDATVQNLGVVDSYFNASHYVGGVVSYNYGTIMNCYNTGAVNGETYVGGVVSYNYGTITNCYNTGAVNGESSVGGVAGKNYYGTVTNCYNAGAVNCESSVGGVVGENNEGTVTNCYYLESTATGGINGADEDGKAVAMTADEFASGEVAYKLGSAFGQTLEGETRQDYPALGGAAVYYGYFSCAEDAEMVYTNDDTVSAEKPDHDMAEATCTVPSTCKREECGHTEGTVNENAHAWNEGAVTTNPTCMEKGVKTYTCTRNSAHTYTEGVAIDTNAHAWNEGVVTTNPTCTEKGVKTFTCTHNSAHTYTEDVDALGHKYDNACDATCNTCGEERTPAEHVDTDENNACDECGAELPKDGLSGGAIAGIVIGSVAVLGGGGFALWWFVFRKKRII